MKTLTVRGRVFVFDDGFIQPLGTGLMLVRDDYLAFRWTQAKGKKDCGKIVQAHRYVCGEPEGLLVDHINGDITDNRRSNLRVVTNKVSKWNRKAAGCTWHRGARKWQATIRSDDKLHYLGLYASKDEATEVHWQAALALRGSAPRTKLQ